MLINVLALASVLLAVACVVIAALTPVSRRKGQLRLAGSISIGILFLLSSALSHALIKQKVFGAVAGAFLIWVGWRKYRLDPQGRTPSAKIL